MAESKSPLEQLDEHYGDVGFVLVDDEPDAAPGMTGREARAFLRGLRPVLGRAGQTLGQAAKGSPRKG